MTLHDYLPCLSSQARAQLYDDLLESGIAISLGGDAKSVFRLRVTQTKGKTKKLYQALCHASIFEIKTMADKMADMTDVVRALKAMTPSKPVKQYLPVKKSGLAVAISSV